MKISVEGAEPENASLIVILLHGGGASGLDFLALSQEFAADDTICYLAPQAIGRHWYENQTGESRGYAEPHFTISVQSVLGLLENHREQAVMIVGFADGAGVAAELLAHQELPPSVKAAWLACGGLVGLPEEWPTPPRHNLPVLISGPQTEQEQLEQTASHFERAGFQVQRSFFEDNVAQIGAEDLASAQKLLVGIKR